MTASVGVVALEPRTDAGADALALAAGTAMYRAKADGRNGYAVYEPAPVGRPQANAHAATAPDSWFVLLRRGLDEDRFVLHAQPVVPISAEGPARYELLLRLRNDDDELLPPGAFLFNAERFDLIGEIDRWVLRQAARLLHVPAAPRVRLPEDRRGVHRCAPLRRRRPHRRAPAPARRRLRPGLPPRASWTRGSCAAPAAARSRPGG